jgi:hypothetical protein
MLQRFFLPVIVLASVASAQVAPLRSAGQTNAALPDAPSTVVQQKKPKKSELLADDPYRPLSANQKLHAWLHKTYSPSTFFAAGIDVAYTNLTSSMRYCCGGDAWGMQYGASVADAETRYFFGTFLFPTLTHQDPRYLPKHSGSFLSRTWYAATRVVVTRKDSGYNTFNSSEFLGIAFSKALSNAYYPEHQRTWGHTTNDILGALEGDAGGNVLTEFTPDIKRIFRRHTPKRFLALGSRLSGYKRAGQN